MVDIDPRNGGKESLRSLKKELGPLPKTLTARTGGGGRHFYFKWSPELAAIFGDRAKLTPLSQEYSGVDLLVGTEEKGVFVYLPPTTREKHEGKKYTWIDPDASIADLPQAWVAGIEQIVADPGGVRGSPRTIPDVIREGERDESLTSLAGTMRRRGASESTILAALREENATRCKPPLSDKQVRKIARSIGSKPVGDDGDVTIVGRMAGSIISERIDWLWEPYMPLGELVLLDGDPGVGKSTLWVELVRAVLAGGGLPYGEILPSPLTADQLEWKAKGRDHFVIPEPLVRQPRILILSAEDDAGKMLRPKLDVAGIPVKQLKRQVKVIDGVTSPNGRVVGFSLEDERHVRALEREISDFDADVLIIDPLSSHIGGQSDTHKETKVRALIDPLTKIAQRFGCTVLAVRHLTKSGRDKSIYRGQGSIAFAAGARSILLAGVNPKSETERTFGLAHIKSNYGPHGPTLGYRMVAVPMPALGSDQVRSRIEWIGIEENLTAADMLKSEGSGKEKRLDEAVAFLQTFLSGGPQEANNVLRQAKAERISEKTLRRAKKLMGVKSEPAADRTEKGQFERKAPWYWRLPT